MELGYADWSIQLTTDPLNKNYCRAVLALKKNFVLVLSLNVCHPDRSATGILCLEKSLARSGGIPRVRPLPCRVKAFSPEWQAQQPDPKKRSRLILITIRLTFACRKAISDPLPPSSRR